MGDTVAAQLVGHEPHGFLSLTLQQSVLPSSTVTQAARSSFRPGALGARLGTTHAIASMRTDKDSG